MHKLVVATLFCCLSAILSSKQDPGKRILFIGDSVTDGNWGKVNGSGRSLSDLNHIFGHGYMFLCASAYQARYPENDYLFFNRGISGNTVSDLKERWQKDVLDLHPDILSILVGINDVLLSERNGAEEIDLKSFEADYREIIERTLQQNPQVKLIIGEPFALPAGVEEVRWQSRNKNCRQLAAVTRKLAQEYGALYLPYQEMFDRLSGQDKSTPQAAYWIWDGVHPTPAGHCKMAQLWMKRAAEKKILPAIK